MIFTLTNINRSILFLLISLIFLALKFAGVGMIQRNLAEKAKPTVEITEKDGKYSLKTLTALKNTEIVFALGEEFDEETADGRKSKVCSKQEVAQNCSLSTARN